MNLLKFIQIVNFAPMDELIGHPKLPQKNIKKTSLDPIFPSTGRRERRRKDEGKSSSPRFGGTSPFKAGPRLEFFRFASGPFNAVGIGEQRAATDAEVLSGNVKLVPWELKRVETVERKGWWLVAKSFFFLSWF